MSEISERYARLSRAFGDKVAAVGAGSWDNPSPCEGWTARDVVRHGVDSHGLFLGFVDRTLDDIPSVDDDPRAAFEAARSVVLADLEAPERAGAAYESIFGPSTFEQGIGRFICFDLIVHGWDLARATGQDDRIDPEDVAALRTAAESFGVAMRGPGAFGPEVEPPPGADDQDRLMAFLGRHP
jgi:uncharacterized protein (TIGR03086 family)